MKTERFQAWMWMGLVAGVCTAEPLWTTNVVLNEVWSRERGAAQCRPDNSGTWVIHTGRLDWALSPQIAVPAKPGDWIEISASVSHSGTGEVGVASAVRNAQGKFVKWDRSYRSTGGSATSLVLTARTVAQPGEQLVARVMGLGTGTARVGTLHVRVLKDPIADLPNELELSTEGWTLRFEPKTAVISVTDRRNGRVWKTLPVRTLEWNVLSAHKASSELEWVLRSVEDELEVRVSVGPTPGTTNEVLWRLTEAKPSGPGLGREWTTPLMIPRPWDSPPGSEIILPLNEGIGFPTDDPHCPPMQLVAFGGHGICMAFWGLVAGDSGIMALLETPDDAGVQTLRAQAGTLVVGPQWYPQHRRWGYERRMRWILFDRGGYVAMCQQYREYACNRGQLVTLREKAERNPNVRFLAGAANVWFMDPRYDPVAMARELRQCGWERVLWSRGGNFQHRGRDQSARFFDQSIRHLPRLHGSGAISQTQIPAPGLDV